MSQRRGVTRRTPLQTPTMAVHTLTIESTADENRIELRSAATWARGPGCTLRFSAEGAGTGPVRMEIDDRVVRFACATSGSEVLTLVVQVATAEDRIALLTERTGRGTLVVRSETDLACNERQDEAPVAATLVVSFKPRSIAGQGSGRRDTS